LLLLFILTACASEFDQEKLQQQIHESLEDVDRHMSTYRSDSELAGINRAASTDWIPVTLRLCRALENALQLSAASNGAFDITVGPLVNLWGFGPDASRFEPPSDEAIDDARARTGRDKLHLDCQQPAFRKDHAGLQIDLSGYAKGLAADEIASLLDVNGIRNYLVEIGGDLRARGHNASDARWRIAIERPDPADRKVEEIIHVSDIGVATSGDYRNFFVRTRLHPSPCSVTAQPMPMRWPRPFWSSDPMPARSLPNGKALPHISSSEMAANSVSR
jgi:thiamine biosynthesis lipoprotein